MVCLSATSLTSTSTPNHMTTFLLILLLAALWYLIGIIGLLVIETYDYFKGRSDEIVIHRDLLVCALTGPFMLVIGLLATGWQMLDDLDHWARLSFKSSSLRLPTFPDKLVLIRRAPKSQPPA